MRVLIINTSEKIGGAAIAARRLTEALNNNGIQTTMLVRDKQTTSGHVMELKKSWFNMWRFIWERIVIWKANHFKKHNLFDVDIANTGIDVTELPEFKQADIIHLHWINQGMLSLDILKKIVASGKPVVWTMHDMWCFTGICHYADGCTKYQNECSKCPKLYGRQHTKDLSWHTFRKKQQLMQAGHIHFVACSRWLEALAKESKLLKGHFITNIPNAINTKLFHPHDKQESRKRLNLPADKKLILFGSMKTTDKRKGADYLIEACHIINKEYTELKDHIAIVIVGKQAEETAALLPFPCYDMHYVSNDHRLVDIYNAVDLYVTPSLQDNLPNTIVEAMACGTPCVGFNVGGIPQMIDHLHNGYVAEYKSAADLANGICWTLSDQGYEELSEAAYRKASTCYSEASVARQYIEIYNKALGQHA